MHVEFKFEIGEAVVTRIGLVEAGFDPDRLPRVLIVNERIAQECPGGIQLHYKTSYSHDRAFHEHELAKISEFDFKGSIEAIAKAEAEKAKES